MKIDARDHFKDNTIELSNKGIKSFKDINNYPTRFIEVIRVNVKNNELTSLEGIPDVPFIDVSGNNLTRIDVKPSDGLFGLYASDNNINYLENLNDNLRGLYVSNNILCELPNDLPADLDELYASNNHIKKLPKSLPSKLLRLDLSNNPITQLINLPDSLEYLNISFKNIKFIVATTRHLLEYKCRDDKIVLMDDGKVVVINEVICKYDIKVLT